MKRSFYFLFILMYCASFLFLSCEKDENPAFTGTVEAYIVGTFICEKVNSKTGIATGNRTERGYCILLEDSENKDAHRLMDFYTFNLPSDLFEFPEEVLAQTYNGSDCGPVFFSDNQKSKFKIRFQYRESTKDEKVNFACGPCTFMLLTFNWSNFKQMTLKEVIKVEEH